MLILTRWKINRIIKKIKSMQSNRVHNQPEDDVLKKEISYYFDLAGLFKKMHENKKFPYPKLVLAECYRAAASMDDAEAHFLLAQLLINEAKCRQNLENEGVFNSSENLRNCKQAFEEAHLHLLAAEKMAHIAAKRLRGLCYINGWGVDPDQKAGFELVIASIDQEGSWDKVPQIFAEIGLNKPEFFSEILQRRKNS